MIRNIWGLMLVSLLLASLGGCGQSDHYTETGDLDDIRDHGELRLVAPRFDQEEGLVRQGIPLQEYREQAEALAHSLGLKPRWVYANNFDQLDDMLTAGEADIIVTNYSITKRRRQSVAFCTPVALIREFLVLPEKQKGDTLADLGTITIAVPKGTAYEETAASLAKSLDNVSVEVLEGNLSDEALLRGVSDGRWQATIIDGNIIKGLLRDFDNLRKGPVVNPRRKIAWAVRPDSTRLRAAVDEFLTSHNIKATLQTKARRDWPQIREAGVLRVLTSNNPASYFMWRGELMGFDYDLIREFAKQHDLRVRMIVKDSASQLFKALQAGEGDVIAASMTATKERKARGWRFSKRYLEVNEQIIGEGDAAPFKSVEELTGRTVGVAPDSAFLGTLKALRAQGINVKIRLEPGATTELLMQQVADGNLDLTMADSHLAALESTYRDDIQPLWTLKGTRNIAWGLRADEPVLLRKLNAYISHGYRGLFYNVTYQRYFKADKTIRIHEKYRVRPGKEISPYDDLVKKQALKYGFDWRMVMSQMYQESQFNPEAHSFAGARGLMQVLPRTAQQFGYSDLHDPKESVAAGVAYLNWLKDRFPRRLKPVERLYFALAAYNAGHGHVEDARRLAQRLGKDPDRWFGQVEDAMRLLARPQYARQARYGYVRGSEPVRYVREIRNRYLGYVQFTKENHISAKP